MIFLLAPSFLSYSYLLYQSSSAPFIIFIHLLQSIVKRPLSMSPLPVLHFPLESRACLALHFGGGNIHQRMSQLSNKVSMKFKSIAQQKPSNETILDNENMLQENDILNVYKDRSFTQGFLFLCWHSNHWVGKIKGHGGMDRRRGMQGL